MAYSKKIEIQLLTEKIDPIGQRVPAWETVFKPWAEVSCLSGREYYAAAQVNSESDYKFRLRYTKAVAGKLTSKLRIVYGGAVFDVVHIEDVKEQHRELILRARQLNGEASV